MTTLFDVGDEIEVTLRGVVKQYTINDTDDDCYVIILKDITDNGTRVYLDSNSLKNAKKIKNADGIDDCSTCKYGWEDERLGCPMCHNWYGECVNWKLWEPKN